MPLLKSLVRLNKGIEPKYTNRKVDTLSTSLRTGQQSGHTFTNHKLILLHHDDRTSLRKDKAVVICLASLHLCFVSENCALLLTALQWHAYF